MELKEAMREIRLDPAKGKEFVNDPATVLKSMGVDVSQHKITKTNEVPTGATHGTCVSGGCGACVSAG